MPSKASLHVFVPVYNEAKYLEATLKSVEEAFIFSKSVGQNLLVTVSDNGSNDESTFIILSFASRRSDWNFIKSEKTLTGDEHFNKLIQSCTTDFICIIGGHDLVSNNYFFELEKSHLTGDWSPLTFGVEYVDYEGTGKNAYQVEFRYVFSDDPNVRFWQSLLYLGNATCIQGLIDTPKLQTIDATKSKVTDLVWLHGLLKNGKFKYSNSCRFVRTNPLRPINYENPKIRKLKSKRAKMQNSLLQAWVPEDFGYFKIKLAQLVIVSKFSLNPIVNLLFRVMRKMSQMLIPAATKGKILFKEPSPIQNIINISVIGER